MKKLLTTTAMASAILLTGCGGGDVNIDAANRSTNDNSVGDNSNNTTIEGGASTSNPCASYSDSGIVRQGSQSGVNCVYGSAFVSLTNPIDVGPSNPVVFTKLDNDGVHIFNDSLVVGRNYTGADLAANGITEGGDGSIIQMEAGATLAFKTSDDYMVINRGSQIFAQGSDTDPVTVTSVSDAVDGTVDPEAVQEWGGMIINGFGVTNKCSYTGNVDAGTIALAGDCDRPSEGKAGAGQTHFGGDNNADNSGVLNYFIVKHTGAQVAEGNELNGISFNAVGSGTVVDYLQAYSTYDDGVEFFGGAVNVSHYIAMYVRDDSIDIDEGYRGTVDYALVIQSETDGNHCVESDGIGSHSSKDDATKQDFITRGLNSQATIKNLTCIISSNDGPDEAVGLGTHDPGAGMRIREAHFPRIVNAVVTTAYQADVKLADTDHNYCLRIEHEGLQAAQDGDLVIEKSIVACSDMTKGDDLPNGTTQLDFLSASNDVLQTAELGEDPTAASNANLDILNGFYSLPLAQMVVGGTATSIVPADSRAYLGAVVADDDWTAGWAYGLEPSNQGQPLWFD